MLESKKIKKRVFIIGCPRSGTTLLQSLIASHPKIKSFPESHFFSGLLPSNRWARKMGMASRNAKKRLKSFFEKVKSNKNVEISIPYSLCAKKCAKKFVSGLDNIALRDRCTMWIEKTPDHLHHIETVERFVKNNAFIHVVREGKDVIASLYDAAQKYPKTWGYFKSIEKCVSRWSKDIKITKDFQGKRKHTVVRYKKLTKETEKTIKEIMEYMDLDNSKRKSDAGVTDEILLEKEHWKKNIGSSVYNRNNEKFYDVFNFEEQKSIERKLKRLKHELSN